MREQYLNFGCMLNILTINDWQGRAGHGCRPVHGTALVHFPFRSLRPGGSRRVWTLHQYCLWKDPICPGQRRRICIKTREISTGPAIQPAMQATAGRQQQNRMSGPAGQKTRLTKSRSRRILRLRPGGSVKDGFAKSPRPRLRPDGREATS